jgi:alanine dehydrogenase
MGMAMEVLETAYQELARQEAVCRPRIDIRVPTKDPRKIYQWGTMEGGHRRSIASSREKFAV